MANIITSARILCSIALLFCPPLGLSFYAIYIAAGITDMLDGAIARRTGTASEVGAVLDTAADFVFLVVCLLRLMPVLHLDTWMYAWFSIIAVIKAVNIVSGFIRQKKPPAIHSLMNRVTGVLLFALPLTLGFIELRFSAAVVCTVATAAAIQEWNIIHANKEP